MVDVIDAEGIRALVTEVRIAIGRDIVFHVPNAHADLNALYNPITDTRHLMTHTQYTVLARIHWTNDEAITATPGGKYFQGEAYAVIDPDDLATAQAAQVEGGKVVVDGHDMTITKIIPVGAPGLTRYRLILVGTGSRGS